MPSLRMQVVRAMLRAVARPLNARVKSPAVVRRGFAAMAALTPPAARVTQVRLAAVPGMLWFHPPGVVSDEVILYLHGGAYLAGAPRLYRAMLGRLALLTGCRIAAPALRLAPEHPAPAAFDDALAAFRAVGVPPERIVLGGDSAGGGLALALLGAGARPAGVFAFSPWTDLTLGGASLRENARADPLLPVERMAEVVALIRGPLGIAADDPRLSPLFAQFVDPPPCLLMVGTDEILRDDSRRMAARLRAAGGLVELEEVPGVFHVWPFAAGILPEADAALRRTAGFIAACQAAMVRR